MSESDKKEKRPYELTGAAYATWYDVGHKLGVYAQSAVAIALCSGSMKLPEKVDPYNAIRISQIAADRGLTINAT